MLLPDQQLQIDVQCAKQDSGESRPMSLKKLHKYLGLKHASVARFVSKYIFAQVRTHVTQRGSRGTRYADAPRKRLF